MKKKYYFGNFFVYILVILLGIGLPFIEFEFFGYFFVITFVISLGLSWLLERWMNNNEEKIESFKNNLRGYFKSKKLRIEILLSLIIGFVFSIFVKISNGLYPRLSPFELSRWMDIGKKYYLGDFLLGFFISFITIKLIRTYRNDEKKNINFNSNTYSTPDKDNVINFSEFKNKKLSTKDENIETLVYESKTSDGSYEIKFFYDIDGNFIIKEELMGNFLNNLNYEYGELGKVTYNVKIKSKVNDTDLYMKSYEKLKELIKQKKVPITNQFKTFFENLNFKVELYTENSLK